MWDNKTDWLFLLQDVLDSLQAKLGLKAMAHFSLVVEHVKSLKRNKLTLLNPGDTLTKVSAMYYSEARQIMNFFLPVTTLKTKYFMSPIYFYVKHLL